MKITCEDHDQITIVGLSGDLTADDVQAFCAAVEQRLAKDTRDFVVDLTETEFIDSAALEALLWVQGQADERLGQVRLIGPTENVRTILRLTRLDKLFDAHADVDEALKSLR